MSEASSTVAGRLPGYWRGLVFIALCWLHGHPAAARAAEPGEPGPGYRLEQLAAQLSDAPLELRADLARVVLSEMAAAYSAEAQRARREASRGDADPDLRRWSAAVERLARELAGRAQAVTDTTPVSATVNRDNSLTLLVDGRPVEVNGPRIDEQADLERRVIERFCKLYPCDAYIAQPQAQELALPDPGPLPHWSFGAQAGPVCSTADGLKFHFATNDDLQRKREACKRVVAELHALIAEIRNYRAGGPGLDWDALAIWTLPAADRHRVTLNKVGDSIQAYLPALAAAPDLLALLRPWLIANVNGLEPPLMVIDADTLLPAVGFLGQ